MSPNTIYQIVFGGFFMLADKLKKTLILVLIVTSVTFILFFIASFIVLKFKFDVNNFKYIAYFLVAFSTLIISLIMKKTDYFNKAYYFFIPIIISAVFIAVSSVNGLKTSPYFIIIPTISFAVTAVMLFIKPIKIKRKNNINKIRRNYEKRRR